MALFPKIFNPGNERPFCGQTVQENQSLLAWQNCKQELTLLIPAVRTAGTSSAAQTNYCFRGVQFWVNVTVIGTSAITPQLRGNHILGGVGPAALFFAAAAIAATGLYVYTIYPGLGAPTGAGNFFNAQAYLPLQWLFFMNHGDASNWTYSVNAILLP